ncbi:MAG: ATP-dependent sacrificial sulfur transferase LarE [Candidatus Faecousia sp.]|nr:ATP-dependent sacrificial sulfur transferase LarE [Candidatus Faecousia sp.]
MELERFFAENPRAAVAFSGGADSSYLLYAAVKAGANVKAYYVKTAFQPQFELEDAKKLAGELGTPMQVLPLDILCNQTVMANPPDRCYHCKKRIFSAIRAAAAQDGFSVLLDGTNASDDAGDRPGIRALKELSVRSPLREAGLTKAEIRRLSKEAGLFTHDKPAYACLATRISTGETITAEKLRRTEWAETYLAGLGLRDFRVRAMGNTAKLQVRASDLNLVVTHREQITAELGKAYEGVLLDLEVRG